MHAQASYDFCLAPRPKTTFYDVESGLLGLGSKQVKCPVTLLGERVLWAPMNKPLYLCDYFTLSRKRWNIKQWALFNFVFLAFLGLTKLHLKRTCHLRVLPKFSSFWPRALLISIQQITSWDFKKYVLGRLENLERIRIIECPSFYVSIFSLGSVT